MKELSYYNSARVWLTIKELGFELKNPKGQPRGRGYVHAMIRMGFPVTDNRRATLAQAKRWLRRHKSFTWRRAYRWQRAEEQ